MRGPTVRFNKDFRNYIYIQRTKGNNILTIKEDMMKMFHQIENMNKRIEIIKKEPNKILELNITIN